MTKGNQLIINELCHLDNKLDLKCQRIVNFI